MTGKPVVIFDGNCGFCRIWIRYWEQLTGGAVEYVTSQDAARRFPEIGLEAFRESVQLVMPSGEVLRGARAVFTTLTFAPGMAWVLWIYEHVPCVAPASEFAYGLVAANRSFFYQVTRFTFGCKIAPLRYGRVEWLFLKILAAIYFIAFASLGVQVTGLIGERGILPVGRYLAAVQNMFGVGGYRMMPTIFWMAHGDWFLRAVCWAGAVIALVLMAGRLERTALVALYILYLSLCTAGQDFMSFQWDMLLLEAGFLAVFLGWSKVMVVLFRWLLFRLMFLSGVVKLTSHDPAWRNLTALDYHWWTQPLPTPVAWYMHQLPAWFQRGSTAGVFFVELLVPFLIFAPRLWRFFGAFCILAFQSLIFLTGNYTFFNLLTMALCLFLFDDAALGRWRWLRLRNVRVKPAVAIGLAVAIVLVSGVELWDMFEGEQSSLVSAISPFGIVNTYGLFAVMTTSRPEIIVEGSNDGVTWLDYEFKFKPGDLRHAPRWVEPYQPRLDWQMWFAALGDWRGNPWFGNFMVRLLEGSPEVLGLLGKNPFPGAPPKYVRAIEYDYSFTDFATRRATGDWWNRTPRGRYFPEVSRDLVH